jgi:hypothetical protein
MLSRSAEQLTIAFDFTSSVISLPKGTGDQSARILRPKRETPVGVGFYESKKRLDGYPKELNALSGK